MKNLRYYITTEKKKANSYLNKTFNIDNLSLEDIYYKMVFCILVPGGKASRTKEAVIRLKDKRLFYNNEDFLLIYNTIKDKVRFPKIKADRLSQLDKVKLFNTIDLYKTKNKDGSIFRDTLVDNIKGIGYKAGSHFIRNLGYRDIAIIDTHILKYRKYFMENHLWEIKPNTKNNYLKLEEGFKNWAKKEFEIDPILLDWLIWTFEGNYKINEFQY